MSDLILVVDGGRSHLRAAAITVDGEVLAELTLKGLSVFQGDWSACAKTLATLPSLLAKEGGFKEGRFVLAAAGLAGSGRESDCRELESLLKTAAPVLGWLIESDALQTLRAAEAKGPVAVALLGTGSAFFARDEVGKVWRTGGWGPLLGDVGSGFEIARQGVLACLERQEEPDELASLANALCAAAGVDRIEELLKVVYSEPFEPSTLAALAPAVLSEAERGDAVALEIIKGEASHVADSAKNLIVKANLSAETRIYFSGGLVKGNPYYFESIELGLKRGLRDYGCQLLGREPYWGGWELAKQSLPRRS